MQNVIVTGGTGFLGRNMIRHLSEEGYAVYAIIRPDSKNKMLLPKREGVVPVQCSLSDIENNKELDGREYDAFYHFAWAGVNRDEIDNDLVQKRSLETSLEALKAAIKLNCGCFLFAGSRSEYGPLKETFREDAECIPQVAYGRAKMEFGNRARELCRGTNTRYIHARIFSVFGVDDHPWSLIYTAVTRMLQNKPMDLSSCLQRWNFMDVRDMADLLLTFQRKRDQISPEDSGIFNVATSDIRPLREFVEEIYHITGSKSELRFGAYQQAADSALSILPNMTKVENTFGWKHKISFSRGIQDMVKQLETRNA